VEVWLFENEFPGFFRLQSDLTLEESMRNGRLKKWKVTVVLVDIGQTRDDGEMVDNG
jgi:hypothetical protein